MKEPLRTGSESNDQLQRLVGQLAEVEAALQALAGDEVDAVVLDDGKTYLLQEAREALSRSRSTQEQMLETRTAILNALPAHIALIDHEGKILEVNEPWRRFAAENGVCVDSDRCGPGANYLAVCDRAAAVSAEARAAVEGIRHVLAGELSEFTFIYPCHSPLEQRWFRLQATPVPGGGESGAVLAHWNVTKQVTAETTSQHLSARLSATLEHLTDAFFTIDREWRITYANGQAERMTGRKRVDIVGQVLWEAFPDAVDTPFEEEYRRAVLENCPVHFETFFEPWKMWIEARAYPSEEGLAIYYHDITERKEAAERLQESEERYRNLVESSHDMIWETDAEGRFTFVNQAARNVYGWEPEEIVGRIFTEFAADDQKQKDQEVFGEAIASGRSAVSYERKVKRKDGGVAILRSRVTLLRDSSGTITGASGTCTDITVQVKAEEKVRESEARLRELAENLRDVFYSVDCRTGRTLYLSPAYAEIFGRRFDYTNPAAYLDAIHPMDRPAVEAAHAVQLAGEKVGIDYRIIRPDGEIRWIYDHSYPVLDANGHPERVVGTARDITHRKRDNERLEEQAALLDIVRDGIVVLDLEDRVTYWNRGAERIFGWSAEEAAGLKVNGLIHWDKDLFRKGKMTVLETGEWSEELQLHTKTGEEIIGQSRWSLVRDQDGHPRNIMVITTDVTEKKKLEQQFLRAQRMESIGTLAGGIAHDLNNVLAPIMMATGLLKLTLNDETSRGLLDTIETNTERGADMVGQVLSFARGIDGQRLSVQLTYVLGDVGKIARETFPKNIHLVIDVSPALSLVTGDSTQLHQVFLNLCVNARDAMPDGGTLTITAKNLSFDAVMAVKPDADPGPYLLVEVADTGSGIAADAIDKVFDPFFTTKELGKGTGLGLSTSMAIVRSHGGFIRVHSEMGVGSCFCLYLPAQVQTETGPSKPERPNLPRGNGELILLVDDEPSIRKVTQRMLESYGYRTLLAGDGAEALDVYSKSDTPVSVAIVDMMMPVMDGVATIRALLTREKSLPVIAASGFTTESKMEQVAEMGVKRFLAKPYTTQALLTMLQEILSDAEPNPG